MIKLLTMAACGLGLIFPASAFAAEQTVTLAVQHMTFTLCPRTVKASLQAVPGVTNVYDDSKAQVDALVKATTNAG